MKPQFSYTNDNNLEEIELDATRFHREFSLEGWIFQNSAKKKDLISASCMLKYKTKFLDAMALKDTRPKKRYEIWTKIPRAQKKGVKKLEYP